MDIFFTVTASHWESENVHLLDQFSNLKGLIEAVNDVPNIRKWIEARPAAAFFGTERVLQAFAVM